MRSSVFLLLLGMLLLASKAGASVAGDVKRGNDFYKDKAYDKAVEKYQKALERLPESDIINFDLGTAHYKNQEYAKAIGPLQKALLSDDPQLRQRAQYNLGNAFFRLGLGQEGQDLNSALGSLERSLASFESVLKNDPQDADARYNFDVVKKELERLKKQQTQQGQCPNPNLNKTTEPKDSSSPQSPGALPQNPESSSAPEQQAAGQESRGQEQNQDQAKDAQGQEQGGAEQKNSQTNAGSESPSGQDLKSASAAEPQRTETASGPETTAAGHDPVERREAEMMLRDYQQREETRGLLNFQKRSSTEAPVSKDW